MKLGIIGATGMLGHNTALAAQRHGHDLVVIHRRGSDLSKLADMSFDAREADLNNLSALTAAFEGLDGVIHCAGYYPTVPRPWREDLDLAMQQEHCFYDACRAAAVGRVTYLGAAIALRKHPLGELGHETLSYSEQPASRNAYLQVKWAMDRLALDMAKAGLHVSIAIPAMTFGLYDYGPTTGRLLVEAANGTLPAFVEGKRNCIFAADAGEGIVRVAEKGRAGERYLLTGENTTMQEVVEKAASWSGVEPPKSVPLAVARTVALLQNLRYRYLKGDPPRISDTAIAVMSSGQHLSGEKARRELGFEASTSLDEAIRQSLEWFREQGYINPEAGN